MPIIAWLIEAREQSMPSRYLIVEDHPLYAEALLLIVRSKAPDADVVLVGTIKAAVAAVTSSPPFDLVLLDLRLPDSHGFEGLMALRIHFPKLPIVVLSAFATEKVKDKALVFGAVASISKAAGRTAILESIVLAERGPQIERLECAAPGQEPYSQNPTQNNVQPMRNKTLTLQQLRVLQSICLGLQNKQIARELDIAETTIKAHVSEILRKLGVSSRTQAVLDVSRLDPGFFPNHHPSEVPVLRAAE